MEEINESDIKKIMAEAWGISPNDIPSDVGFNDIIQWDSVGHVNLLVALEKEYNVVINFEKLTELVDLKSIIACLKDNVNVG